MGSGVCGLVSDVVGRSVLCEFGADVGDVGSDLDSGLGVMLTVWFGKDCGSVIGSDASVHRLVLCGWC